jgi:DNA invertase Pin-like site-specific DNA recombinase
MIVHRNGKMKSGIVGYFPVRVCSGPQSQQSDEPPLTAVLKSGGEVVASFVEVESGKRDDRLELAPALAVCRKHNATLLGAKLDRLSRNVAFIATLMESGVDFVAVDMPHASRLTVHILAAVAEHAREMIAARTKAALQAAKQNGVVLGSPAPERRAAAGLAVIRRKGVAHAINVEPIVRSIMASGAASLREIAAALNARGIRTSREGV